MKKWGFLFASLMLICSVQADILYVPAAYPTIQSAVTAAVDTDTVIVSPGTYYENIDMDGKAITLQSTDPNDPAIIAATILDGSTVGSVITCESGEDGQTVISGFRIQHGSTGGYGGGGIYCFLTSPTITNCVFFENNANLGGAIFCYAGDSFISNCTFIANTAGQVGGGIDCYAGASPTIMNSMFIGNDADFGGGLACTSTSSPVVVNCTFSGNSADYGGGIYCSSNSDPEIINTLVWGNLAAVRPELYRTAGNDPLISYSNIAGCGGSGENWDTAFGIDNGGNLDEDPLFVDADGADDIIGNEDDDLHLDPFSPCINQGDPAVDYAGQMDIDMTARVAYCTVDIGADEVHTIGWDFSPDGQIDVADLVLFAEGWLSDYDLSDFTALTEIWMCGVE